MNRFSPFLDERFRRAYREDSELAARVRRAGHAMVRGRRQTSHPVRPASAWVSLTRQRGNADDALLRRLYGRGWRRLTGIAGGRRVWHIAVSAVATAAIGSLAARRRRVAVLAGVAWLVATGEFALRRIMPGPRTTAEVGAMLATSVLIPPTATLHWLLGWVRHRGARPGSRRHAAAAWPPRFGPIDASGGGL